MGEVTSHIYLGYDPENNRVALEAPIGADFGCSRRTVSDTRRGSRIVRSQNRESEVIRSNKLTIDHVQPLAPAVCSAVGAADEGNHEKRSQRHLATRKRIEACRI
jgi:hypothetical protein